MARNRTTWVIIVVFLLTLGAGVVAGLLASRMPLSLGSPKSGVPHSPLAEELELSAEQSDQMRTIWEGVRTLSRQCADDAKQLQRRRDDAVVAMLDDQQKLKYAALTKQYADEFASLAAKREAAFRSAVEQTRRMLTESQRARYDQIIKDRLGTEGGRVPMDVGAAPLDAPTSTH